VPVHAASSGVETYELNLLGQSQRDGFFVRLMLPQFLRQLICRQIALSGGVRIACAAQPTGFLQRRHSRCPSAHRSIAPAVSQRLARGIVADLLCRLGTLAERRPSEYVPVSGLAQGERAKEGWSGTRAGTIATQDDPVAQCPQP